MVAAVVFDQFGLEHLRLEERTRDSLSPHQVRVAVHAVSLNYRDLLMVQGHYNPRLSLPLVPCSDGAGVVLETGTEVTEFAVGDRVCSTMIPEWQSGKPSSHVLKTTLGGPVDGLLAQERVLPWQALLKIPDHLDFVEAACLPVAGLTAWSSLVTEAGTGPDDTVLLLGTGGVSIMALAIAKSIGATVAITSSSDSKLARARTLGADVTINYREYPEWAARVMEHFPDGVDTVLEVGGDGTFNQSVKATRNGGTVALIGVLAARNKPIDLTRVLMKRIRVQGILVGCRDEFRAYLDFVGQNRLKPVIDKVFPGLDASRSAFELMKTGGHFGKIAIRIAR